VGIKWNFWKKAAAKINTFAKNAGVRIRKNYFQDLLLDKVAKEVILARPEHVRLEHADSEGRDWLWKLRLRSVLLKRIFFMTFFNNYLTAFGRMQCR
jgi:hypothetical protein